MKLSDRDVGEGGNTWEHSQIKSNNIKTKKKNYKNFLRENTYIYKEVCVRKKKKMTLNLKYTSTRIVSFEK